MPEELDDRVRRAAARVAALRDAFRDPKRRGRLSRYATEDHCFVLTRVPESEIQAVEEEHGVVLPDEYRRFLLLAGRPAGPGYGLLALADSVTWDPSWGLTPQEQEALEASIPPGLLSRPFPHIDAFDPDEVEDDSDDDDDAGYFEQAAGTLALCDEGCGRALRLVVTGPTRGEVWMDARTSDAGFIPLRVTFMEWYERWLDDVESGREGSWWAWPRGPA